MGSIRKLGTKQVRVFGDDIIVPEDCSAVLVGLLTHLGLKVNPDKTFLGGAFKESCGIDAFRGDNVTTINVTCMPTRASPSTVIAAVDVHNNLLTAGLINTAAFMRKTAKSLGFNQVRETKHGSGSFGWQTYDPPCNTHLRGRYNLKLHRFETRCLQLEAVTHRAPANGNPGVLQFFTEAAKEVTSAVSTLGYLTRRPQAKLRLRWVH